MSPSILQSEIYEQSDVIQHLLDAETVPVKREADRLNGQFDGILIAARGTSDNAARYAQYLFGAHNRLPVTLATPSLFTIYNRPPLMKHLLVMGISQSGQSPDIVAVLAEARQQHQPTLALTNDPDSPLSQNADWVVPLYAGPERAIAATKTYTASLAALALISTALDGDPTRLDDLKRIPEQMGQTLRGLSNALEHVERYRYMDRCAVIGRGFNYATAFEFALKVKELTGVVAEPYSSADFRHGPIAIVSGGFPVLVVAHSGSTADDLGDLVYALRQRRSELVLISDRPELLYQANLALPIPAGVPEWISPLLTILPGQCFALTLAIERGLNPDQPEGLTKITETY